MDPLKKFITTLKKGEVIYKEDTTQTDFYIINKGKIQLKSEQINFILAILEKGDFFGEESLNADQNSGCTAEVLEDATLIKIPYSALTDMMKQNTDISLKILKKLSEKHIKMQAALQSIIQKTGTPIKEKARKEDKYDDTSEQLEPDVKAYLVIQRSNRIVQISKQVVFLGRRDYTTGYIPEIDLTDEDEEKYISRKHSKITFNPKDKKFYLSEESGAINGTFLNGEKLKTGVKYELKNNDEFTLCHLNVAFKI